MIKMPVRHIKNLLTIILLGTTLIMSACSSLEGGLSEGTPEEQFAEKITGAVWYQEFNNAHGRIPSVQFQSEPGVDANKLEAYLRGRPSLLHVVKKNPDYILIFKKSSQAALIDSQKNIIWLSGTEGAIKTPPKKKPIILWRGWFIGARASMTSMSAGDGITVNKSSAEGGLRLGYSFTNLGDISAYMPDITFDSYTPFGLTIPLSAVQGMTTSSNQTLSGNVSMIDVAIDPLRFGWPIFGESTLISLGIGVGDVIPSISSSSVNLEGHITAEIAYRLFEHWTPYFEFSAENIFINSPSINFTYNNYGSYSTTLNSFSLFLIRAMVGIDWYPWITKANISGGSEP